tara:strand:- start:1751 stop:2272 length:522 start_codon:yes stop_codon:yes gene_type:complete
MSKNNPIDILVDKCYINIKQYRRLDMIYKTYFAYGMNTNNREMQYRCPLSVNLHIKAKYINHRLAFRSVADFEKADGYKLYGNLWFITDLCEKALDRLEGYPNLYNKQYIDVEDDKGNTYHNVMIYKMNADDYAPPHEYYWKCLKQGYKNNKLPYKQLFNARQYAQKQYTIFS